MDLKTIVSHFSGVVKMGDGYNVRCPAHKDKNPSLSINQKDGKILMHCQAGCKTKDVLASANLSMRDLTTIDILPAIAKVTPCGENLNPLDFNNYSGLPCTLFTYASMKCLDSEFLQSVGVDNNGRGIRIVYHDEEGNQVAVRKRTALMKGSGGDERFKWVKGAKLSLYGLERLKNYASDEGIVLVEGESDCHTLWSQGIPAVGLPGASNWKDERDAKALEKFKTIYVVIEPDAGGKGVLKWLEASSIKDRVRLVHLPANDISELYVTKPDRFKGELLKAINTSVAFVQHIDYQPWTPQQTDACDLLSVVPPSRVFIATCNGFDFIPKGIVGVVFAAGGTGKSFTLAQLAYMFATKKAFGPIESTKKFKVLFVAGEDDLNELKRRFYNICKGKPPIKNTLFFGSVFGELGPLMKLDRGQVELTAAYKWLEDTVQAHKGLEILIIDPKSRFYGLDENSADHSTQWIQKLEYLCKKYKITILFSHHTAKANNADINQNMGRGSSALVDACRWQAGLVRLNEVQAKKLNIDNHRLYIEFDMSKSNYSADLNESLFFKRNKYGLLKYVDIRQEGLKDMAMELMKGLKWNHVEYSIGELRQGTEAEDFCKELKEKCPGFTREKTPDLVKILIKNKLIEEVIDEKHGGSGRHKKVLRVIETREKN